jgi:hypothetical protein
MTARDPLARYPTAVEAADAIAASLGQAPVAPHLPEQHPYFAGGGPEPVTPVAGTVTDDVPPAPVFLPALVVSRAAHRPPRRKADPSLSLALGGLGLLLATVATVAGVIWLRPGAGPREPAAPRVKRVDEPVREGTATDAPDSGAEPAVVPADSHPAEAPVAAIPPDRAPDQPVVPSRREGKIVLADTPGLPWAPPNPPGPPPSLSHLPPGTQLAVLVRPAALLATEEGRLFLRAIGADAERALAEAARLAGCRPEQLDAVQVGWRAADDGLELGAVVSGTATLPVAGDGAARTAAWGEREGSERSGETVYRGSPLAYWLPRRHGGRALVVGPSSLVDELVAAEAERGAGDDPGGIEASLPRDLETLVGTLDGGRHVTLFGSPAWLESDGSALMAGPLARLGGALAELFAGGIRAAALGLHFGDTSYAELDVVAPADVPSARLAATLATRIAALPATAEASCNALDPHPFGRRLVMRLPRMLEVLAENVRAGGEGPVAVVNCHLPPHAAHNLALAAELALAQTPGSGAEPAAGARAAAPPTGIRDKLAKRISLSLPRDTLERSIQLLAEETGVPIEIRGADLQLEGITKNQSFALFERDKAAEEILRVILARSNPDGKLVYVVRTRDGGESLEITTRAAAGKRGDPIPPVFDSPPPPGDSPQ